MDTIHYHRAYFERHHRAHILSCCANFKLLRCIAFVSKHPRDSTVQPFARLLIHQNRTEPASFLPDGWASKTPAERGTRSVRGSLGRINRRNDGRFCDAFDRREMIQESADRPPEQWQCTNCTVGLRKTAAGQGATPFLKLPRHFCVFPTYVLFFTS